VPHRVGLGHPPSQRAVCIRHSPDSRAQPSGGRRRSRRVRRRHYPRFVDTRGQRFRALPSFRERLYAPRGRLRVFSVPRSITATARQCATVLGARSRMATAPKILLDSCCLDPRLIIQPVKSACTTLTKVRHPPGHFNTSSATDRRHSVSGRRPYAAFMGMT
jgi:hypothetical protein